MISFAFRTVVRIFTQLSITDFIFFRIAKIISVIFWNKGPESNVQKTTEKQKGYVRILWGMVLLWIDALSGRISLYVTSVFGQAKSAVVKGLTTCGVFLVLLWIAIFMYGSFYYTYMPTVSHIADINLQFSNCKHDDESCPYPHANLSLVTGNQYEVLMRGQPYIVQIDLHIPESQVNQHIGNFMVLVQFYSRNGEVVRQASRASMLHYKSLVLRTLETLIYMPFYIFGTAEQKQNIPVLLLTHYVEDPYRPTLGAYIEVQNRFIEIYEAQLKIHAKFTGLRYILFHWPVTSAFVGIVINMGFLVTIALLSWYNFCFRTEDHEVAPHLLQEERRRRLRAKLQEERVRAAVKAELLEQEKLEPESLQARGFDANIEDELLDAEEDTRETTLLSPIHAKPLGELRHRHTPTEVS